VDAEEAGEESLDGLKVLVWLETLGKGEEEVWEVVERDEGGAEGEVGRGGRERFEVGEEGFDCLNGWTGKNVGLISWCDGR
jgi:hypothetical protein